jgi:DMSO/TMAO reductase YedYZ heme-binding membrane subunit
LLPRFDSLCIFLQQGGPPTLYLFVVASLAAALRKPIGKGRRAIHILSYLAFLLATVHTILPSRVSR